MDNEIDFLQNKVKQLENEVRRLNYKLSFHEYLNSIEVTKDDLEYCYQTNIFTALVRCFHSNIKPPLDYKKRKIIIYENDEWTIFSRSHGNIIWKKFHIKMLNQLLQQDNIDVSKYEIFVKKLLLYKSDTFEPRFYNYIKKNYTKSILE